MYQCLVDVKDYLSDLKALIDGDSSNVNQTINIQDALKHLME